MQTEAVFMAPEMAPPRPTAARAIAVPIIARMSAYSAAEAPESSRSMLMNVFMFYSFRLNALVPQSAHEHCFAVIEERHANLSCQALFGTEFGCPWPAPPSAQLSSGLRRA